MTLPLTLLCLPAVYINDKELSPRKKKQKHAWRFEDGSAVEMSWDPYTPGIGNAIVVATGGVFLSMPACLYVNRHIFPLRAPQHAALIWSVGVCACSAVPKVPYVCRSNRAYLSGMQMCSR